jgi:N-terminal half of MaoC dehydratase
MADEPIITEEMRALIGVETPPITIEAEKGDLRRFTEATGETDPRFAEVFPPTFFCPDPIIAAQRAGLRRPWPFKFSIDGGSEWEFHRSVRVGDTLTVTAKIADLYEKRGSAKTGRMLFTIVEVRCTNQRQELVGIARGTGIVYEGPQGKGQEPQA